ncbi:DEAD-box ATP-dependent RNA helicase FANCM isoform X1 [Lycium ferocissimum]|uniref:DEAD-box ATP-dependent RNA helicase FANCM isoform X1 n=2 Tax=Lycium ferocissimum TaxID=112874 RepID=UPI0028151635|nr:DEAD-box ATP-dependent RNA helicase FANCM isoform X1 [Lycium ferocissimum]
MASSSTPLYIVDDEDDDEFDWDLAVKEIDGALEATAISNRPSSSNFASTSHSNHQIKETHKYPFASSSSRQSTLDKFIQNPTKNAEKSSGFGEKKENDEFESCGTSYVEIDQEAAKTWIFPVNFDRRDYQFSIVRTALFSNTLVTLPTGLGKTFIAAVVMYNYFRWFPEGKIVFAAPSRPLVLQQVEALHKFVDIPQECTIDLTGQTNPLRRASLWKERRVFFVTPQVLEKDIHSGICFVKHLVCLVIDEAHRASGNYSYCVVVRELMAFHVQVRILALTATPGSKRQAVQKVIDNLQISTLEYRNETDPDVLPYVHARKIEQITVPMGQQAVEVGDLLSEVMDPLVNRLRAYGLSLNNRTLSPHLILDSRSRFREAPPQNLPQVKFQEIDGLYGVLITLSHILKLLSSHGIKSAFEMLDEKLQSKLFGRLMGRNEILLKAKRLMQQVVSHGAPSPKLSKTLEILNDHFKTSDPKKSRVIIFSNFRQSVSDILLSLRSLTDLVKATEFIGQSSGKTSKGQSQKNQQAVLEKFRTGEYNVIVATSIGEEGLDIMEVDLVICFDANISPLRMIQRMGRTGRKHEGRVVVLAYEGRELKGYLQKQTSGKTIIKDMRNGGMNSFSFHSSPRMIPHIFKPEVQFLRLSIPQFVPRGKNTKDVHPIQVSAFQNKLSDEEASLLAKYFKSTGQETQDAWKPSLIAFRHSQAFPSKVHRVVHSFRTGMLIDAMQNLQEMPVPRDVKASNNEDENSENLSMKVEATEPCEENLKGCSAEDDCKTEENNDSIPVEMPSNRKTLFLDIFQGENSHAHGFLFSSEFVSVDDQGRVIVSSLAQLSLKETLVSKYTSTGLFEKFNLPEKDPLHGKVSANELEEKTDGVKGVSSTHTGTTEKFNLEAPRICVASNAKQQEIIDLCEGNFGSPNHKVKPEGKSMGESLEVQILGTPIVADEPDKNFGDMELSPRLTNFINSGFVPESPTTDAVSKDKDVQFMVKDIFSTPKESSEQNEKTVGGSSTCGKYNEMSTPIQNIDSNEPRSCKFTSVIVEDNQTPMAKMSGKSCSEDWQLGSTDKSESIGKKRKFRRLLKHGDLPRRKPPDKLNTGTSRKGTALCGTASHTGFKHGRAIGEKRQPNIVTDFIEEEAEVSSEVSVSDDEEDKQDFSTYDDSFIDDRINPTAADSQAEAGEVDMIAIYRRSLLTQSPIPNLSTDYTPDSEVRADESKRSSGTADHHTPQTDPKSVMRNSSSFQQSINRISPEAMPCSTTCSLRENNDNLESRKRKLSYYQATSLPVVNLQNEFSRHSTAAGGSLHCLEEAAAENEVGDPFDDDLFYQSIDFDAVEEEAARMLRNKSKSLVQNTVISIPPITQIPDGGNAPSFDLGI